MWVCYWDYNGIDKVLYFFNTKQEIIDSPYWRTEKFAYKFIGITNEIDWDNRILLDSHGNQKFYSEWKKISVYC